MKKLLLYSALTLNASILATGQNALDFDGINDMVTTNYPGIMGSANRTFEAWVYVPSSAPASNLCVLDYGLNQVGSRNSFSVAGNRGLTYISGGVNTNISTPANVVPLDQWAHVAFVLNNGTGFLYVNGVQQGTGNLTGVNTPPGNQPVQIGERVIGSSIPFQGIIDEVRVWSLARTPAELLANMSGELCSLEPGLQLYLRFNQGIAAGNNTGMTSATDDSGNAYTGTLNGFSLTGANSNWVTGATLFSGISYSTTPETACGSYTWSADSMTYTMSGTYTAVLTGANMNGCDSIATLDLTINTVNTGVTDNGDLTITATAPNATYQWLDCDSGFAAIAGATDQTYLAPGNGMYAVEVTENGCTDTSACVTIDYTGIDPVGRNTLLSMFPNPTSGNVTIEANAPIEAIEIMNLDGKVVQRISSNTSRVGIDLTGLAKGVYVVKVSDQKGHGVPQLLLVE